MTNINDVAKRARVSKATVSRYINNKKVSDELSTRIKQAISELEFTPNKIAQGLSTSKSDMIGIIVPDLLNPFFSEIISKIENYADINGITCLIFSSKGSLDKENDALSVASLFKVRGVILITNDNSTTLDNVNIPVVALDRYINNSLVNIGIDNNDVGCKIASCMNNHNVKKVLYIQGQEDIDTSKSRLESFIKESAQYDYEYTVVSTSYDNLVQVDMDINKIENINEYDGIYMGNEIIAFSVLKQDLKKDAVKMTIDGTYLNNYLLDNVYTLKQPIDQLAKLAFDKLINWNDKKEYITLKVEGE